MSRGLTIVADLLPSKMNEKSVRKINDLAGKNDGVTGFGWAVTRESHLSKNLWVTKKFKRDTQKKERRDATDQLVSN